MLHNDYDPPAVYDERMVTARKEHVCCECHRPIQPGDKYQQVDGIWEGEWSHFKTCSTCLDLRDELLGWQDGYLFGYLWEDLRDAEFACLVRQ